MSVSLTSLKCKFFTGRDRFDVSNISFFFLTGLTHWNFFSKGIVTMTTPVLRSECLQIHVKVLYECRSQFRLYFWGYTKCGFGYQKGEKSLYSWLSLKFFWVWIVPVLIWVDGVYDSVPVSVTVATITTVPWPSLGFLSSTLFLNSLRGLLRIVQGPKVGYKKAIRRYSMLTSVQLVLLRHDVQVVQRPVVSRRVFILFHGSDVPL